MIKKILLTLGIIATLIINFSYGIDYTRCVLVNINAGLSIQMAEKNGVLRQSQTDGNYYLGVFNKGELLTQHGGIEKKLLSVNSNTIFFRDENGYPYIFWNNANQGNYSYYYECDEITTSGRIPSLNCGNQSYEITSGTIEYFKEFFASITDDDYFGYNKDHQGGGIEYCFSSHNYGATICFDYSNSQNTECPLKNSKGYSNLTVDNISSDILYDGPGFMFTGGDSVGSNSSISGGQSPISGGYTYMNCTNQNVLAYYIRTFGYNGSMCNIVSGGVADGYYPYGTLLEFCNIIYIFNNEDLGYYNKPYTGHNKNIVCNSPGAYFTGDEPVSIDWSHEFPGVINGSGEYEVQSSDSFLINLSNVLKGNFYLPESGDFGLGYLPRYIILGFMGVIFFNFIRK